MFLAFPASAVGLDSSGVFLGLSPLSPAPRGWGRESWQAGDGAGAGIFAAEAARGTPAPSPPSRASPMAPLGAEGSGWPRARAVRKVGLQASACRCPAGLLPRLLSVSVTMSQASVCDSPLFPDALWDLCVISEILKCYCDAPDYYLFFFGCTEHSMDP